MRSTINSPGRSACPLLSRERWRCSQISASLWSMVEVAEVTTPSLSSTMPRRQSWGRLFLCLGQAKAWWFHQIMSPDMWPCRVLRLTDRSEEHTSELQSPCNLVCRLLLEKKKIVYKTKLAVLVESA